MNYAGSTPMHAHTYGNDRLATDPVCGMKVPAGGPLSEVHRGTTYWFCDPACADTFRDDPDRWVSDAPLAHDHADDEHHG